MDTAFVEHLQKRFRKLQKRKVRLDGYQQIASEDPSKLNEDQLAALDNKDSVDAPFKELSELIAFYEANKDQAAAAQEQLRQEIARQAKEEARQEARSILATTTQFLRTAAVKHQTPDPNLDELAAIDVLLHQLYIADDKSLEAIEKLHAGSTDIVAGEYSFAQIRDLGRPQEPESTQSVPEQVDQPQKPSISFLQDDELASTQVEPEAEPEPETKPVEGLKSPAEELATQTNPIQANGGSVPSDSRARSGSPDGNGVSTPKKKKSKPKGKKDASSKPESRAEAVGKAEEHADSEGWISTENKRAHDKKRRPRPAK